MIIETILKGVKRNVALAVLGLGAVSTSSCGNESFSRDTEINDICNEFQYWEEVSDDFPYPGVNCRRGSTKTALLSLHIPGQHRYSSTQIDSIVSKINRVYNEHGINFDVGRVAYVNTNDVNKIEPTNGEINILLLSGDRGGNCAPNSVCVTGEDTLAHELGHYLGLQHTHSQFQPNFPEDRLRLIDWVTASKECHIEHDGICDTPYDCDDSCEENLGCEGIVLEREGGYKNLCGEDYDPLTNNVMSYYNSDNPRLTNEQGSRARYFLNKSFAEGVLRER